MTRFFNVRICSWLFLNTVTNRTLHTLKKTQHFKTAIALEQKFLPTVPGIELQKTENIFGIVIPNSTVPILCFVHIVTKICWLPRPPPVEPLPVLTSKLLWYPAYKYNRYR